MQMMRERRGRNAELFLQAPDRQPAMTGPHERPVDLKAGRTAESFKLLGGLFDVHGNSLDAVYHLVNAISRSIEGLFALSEQPAHQRHAGERAGELRQDERQDVTGRNPGKGGGQRPRDRHGRVGERG